MLLILSLEIANKIHKFLINTIVESIEKVKTPIYKKPAITSKHKNISDDDDDDDDDAIPQPTKIRKVNNDKNTAQPAQKKKTTTNQRTSFKKPYPKVSPVRNKRTSDSDSDTFS